MLNDNRVISYIKTNLGFPFHTIELTDEQIMEYLRSNTIREFSYYIPEVRKMNLDIINPASRVPDRANEFYLNEPEGREILNIKDIVFPAGNLYAMGHPIMGTNTLGGMGSDQAIRNWALDVERAGLIKKYSRFDYTFQFTHPNIVRISPNPLDNSSGEITIEYERIQSEDFGGIPNDIQMTFLELCLADMMIVIGRIRKKYGDGNLRTPFGEIPLGSEILDEGKEKKREIIEKLSNALIPNVRVSFG